MSRWKMMPAASIKKHRLVWRTWSYNMCRYSQLIRLGRIKAG